MMYQLSALWLLLTAAATAELYDELPDDNEVLLQEENEVDTGPPLEPRVEESEAARLQELLLFRLIGAQLWKDTQDANRRSHKRQDLELADVVGMAKRVAPRRARLHRWWKTKKGRGVGNQMCYFKLCAFRNPA